ncbi:MAG: glycoside hydrolase family 127 protein, partial [Bacteroidota bacterium]|nr:glycoside hydrolase family 127 protein [Bacteroidota bacterium]
VEGADNNGNAWNIILPENIALATIKHSILNEPVIAIQAKAPVITTTSDGSGVQTQQKEVIAIPYYTWANRGKNQMQVWLPTKVKEVKINSSN